MKKSNKYAINAAVFGALIALIANAVKQQSEIAITPDQKFDWARLMKAILRGAAVGGAFGFGVGSVVDHRNSFGYPVDFENLEHLPDVVKVSLLFTNIVFLFFLSIAERLAS